MTIQGFQEYGGFYNQYRVNEIPKVDVADLQNPSKEQVTQSNSVDHVRESSGTQTPDQRSRTADLENLSLTFQKQDTFDYIGSESSLDQLDMKKAVSDLQKDQVLQQYQYFVGSFQDQNNQNQIISNEDGQVIQK